MKSTQLKAEREVRGWSQAKIAEVLGINTRTVSRWERGLAMPQPYYRELLSELFGKTIEELGLFVGPEENGVLHGSFRPSTQDFPEQVSLLDPTIPESPGDGGALLGRHDLLMEVKERLFAGENVALTDLDGLPGIGKTALVAALVTDQEVQEHFCDGILWAQLGPRPNMVSHLVRWGKLLGITPSQVKAINNRQAWGYALQDAIDTRQMLLIIDDAWTVEDALSLQIGGIACAHVLTTRQSQVAFAFDQTGSMIIPELEETERIALLSRFVPQLVEQDPQGASALVQAVGGLPLALTLMGSYLTSPSLPVQPQPLQMAMALLHYTQESLHVHMPRALEESSASPGETMPLSLRAVIALCDQQLSPQAHAALCALAIFLPKSESFSQEAALSVTQQPIEILGELCDAGLLEACGQGRYILHRAVADYARSQDQAQVLTAQQQQPRSRAENIQIHQRDKRVSTFGPFNRFSWRAWGILATILLATLLMIVGLLTFNIRSLYRSVQVTNSPTTQSSISYEAEAPENLLASARLMKCPECSGGKRVGYIGLYTNKDRNGVLQFNNIWEKSAGDYSLTIYYVNGYTIDRSFYISVKGGPEKVFTASSTGDWNTVGKLTTTVHLNAGDNSIVFFNPLAPAPDIDRIVVSTQSGTTPTATDMPTSYEAAAPGNTLSGGAKVWSCIQCSGGKRVRYIDKGGALQFNKVSAKRTGQYTLWVYYVDGEGLETSRALYISVNGGSAIAYKTPGTSTWSGLGTLRVTVSLNAGNNTIKLFNPSSAAPNLDRIVVSS